MEQNGNWWMLINGLVVDIGRLMVDEWLTLINEWFTESKRGLMKTIMSFA